MGQMISISLSYDDDDDDIQTTSTTTTTSQQQSLIAEIESYSSSYSPPSTYHNHLVPYHRHQENRLNELLLNDQVNDGCVSIVRLRYVSEAGFPFTSTPGVLMMMMT